MRLSIKLLLKRFQSRCNQPRMWSTTRCTCSRSKGSDLASPQSRLTGWTLSMSRQKTAFMSSRALMGLRLWLLQKIILAKSWSMHLFQESPILDLLIRILILRTRLHIRISRRSLFSPSEAQKKQSWTIESSCITMRTGTNLSWTSLKTSFS